MEIRTEVYECTHGKAPKGFGTWAFATKRNPEVEEIFFTCGTYSEAKKAAKKHFAGEYTVYVLS